MGDDDMIRRGDALKIALAYASGEGAALAEYAIRAIPAADARAEAARVAGDAAVAILLRNEPDASPLKQQLARQAVAVPILALIGGAK